MLGFFGAIALLAAFGAAGAAVLRRTAPFLGPFERLVHGLALGTVAASLALLALASLLGLTPWLVLSVGAACVGAAGWLGSGRGGSVGPGPPAGLASTLGGSLAGRLRAVGPLPALVLGLLVLRWLLFWSGALSTDEAGLWAAHRILWADWAQHLGDVTSFAYGENFPPLNPRFAGAPFNYHYLTSITTAALVKLGLGPAPALCLHSFVFSVVIALAVYAFSRRLGLGRGAASLAVVLLVLGGGLGWWLSAREMVRSGGALASLWNEGAQHAANLRWPDIFFAMIAPQRGMLYGLPLGLLTLTLLFEGLERDGWRLFLVAGAVAGLLPFAHLGTLLALALLAPWLFLLFPRRHWLGFLGAWALLGLPQLLAQQGGAPGALSALRPAPGWVAPPDSWVRFWLVNLGLFLPLLLVTFAWPGLPSPRGRRFLLAFQPLFVLANLFVFQPWDWDNTKVLVWWYLASCLLVAGLLARLWRMRPAAAVRPLVVVVVLSLTLSGLLQNLNQLLGRDRQLLLTAEEIDLARRVRDETDPRSLFAVGLRHNHPVPVLSGRRVLMSYPGWLWSQGIDYLARERELRAIFALEPEAARLIERYGVDYVVVGPDERERFGADPAAWRARYPCVIRTESYEVFAVAPGDRHGATARSARPPTGRSVR